MSTSNGSSTTSRDSYFYETPKPGFELAWTKSPFRGKSLETEISIDPARTRIAPLAARELDNLSDLLLRWKEDPSKTANDKKLKGNNLEELLKGVKPEDLPGTFMTDFFHEAGMTSVVDEAVERLNASLTDVAARHIFARKGILHYAAYRGIKALKVKDADGLLAGFSDVLKAVKAYVNVKLLHAVIADRSIQVNEAVLKEVEKSLSSQAISYLPGKVIPRILQEIEDLSKGIGIEDKIRAFLSANKDLLPYGADIEYLVDVLREKLVSLGVSASDFDDPGFVSTAELNAKVKKVAEEAKKNVKDQVAKTKTELTGKIADQKTTIDKLLQRLEQLEQNQNRADDLTKLKNIGNALQPKLFAKGVFTYRQVVQYNAEQLEALIPKDISVEQAKATIEDARQKLAGNSTPK